MEFPLEMSIVHSVFQVSMSWKLMGDPNFIVTLEDVSVKEKMTYENVLIKILDQ